MTSISSIMDPNNDRSSCYDDLPINTSGEIRLLELLPGLEEDAISCCMTVAAVHSAVFEALSYTWGESNQGRNVTLNGRSGFSVTDNLFAALRRLRRAEVTRSLWVDALCINQADLDERAQQVKLMRDIYRGARQVIIWLGDANEPVEVACSPFRPPKTVVAQQRVRFDRPSYEEDLMMRTLDAALSVTEPQWWTRVWIIQEAVLAEVPLLCFGIFELPWHVLGTLRERMSAMMELTLSQIYTEEITDWLNEDCPPVGSLGYYVRRYRSTGFDDGFQALETLRTHRDTWSGLSEIASVAAQNNATDKRDRVFAFHGLWSGRNSGLLVPNYKKPLADIYANATFADMEVEGNLRVLNLVRPARAQWHNLPSWALDFSFEGIRDETPFFPKVVTMPNMDTRSKRLAVIDQNFQRFTCRGFIVDHVDKTFFLPRNSFNPQLGEEELGTAMKFLPTGDAYKYVRDYLTTNCRIARDSAANRDHNIYATLPKEVELLALELGVQTDPISNAFLWWLQKVAKVVPRREDFIELYEWWKSYSSYQATGFDRKHSTEVYFYTECGFIGRGLWTLASGDFVALLDGMELPVILRKSQGCFQFLGLSWVNGMTMGELGSTITDLSRKGIVVPSDITIN